MRDASLRGTAADWPLAAHAPPARSREALSHEKALSYEIDRESDLVASGLGIAVVWKPSRGEVMKIVVVGGTGLIGSRVVEKLKQKGHEAIAATPNTGVNTITGEGLKEAMAGAQVVIDLANSPSFEDKAVLEFFQTSGRNLLAAEAAAGVKRIKRRSLIRSSKGGDYYLDDVRPVADPTMKEADHAF